MRYESNIYKQTFIWIWTSVEHVHHTIWRLEGLARILGSSLMTPFWFCSIFNHNVPIQSSIGMSLSLVV